MADDRGCGAPRPPGAECRRWRSGRGDAEELRRLADRWVLGVQAADAAEAQPRRGPVEEGDVRPQRLERGPPAEAGRSPAVEGERLRLGHASLPGGHV